jgi:hypothetical protein
LSGCTERGTNAAEVQSVLARCHIAASEILWRVDDHRRFSFGRRAAAAPPLAEAKEDCLLEWVRKEHIRAGVIGWER